LLISRNLLNDPAIHRLEDREVLENVQKVTLIEKPLEQNFLRSRLVNDHGFVGRDDGPPRIVPALDRPPSTQALLLFIYLGRIRILPFQIMLHARGDRAHTRLVAMGRDHHGVVVKELLSALLVRGISAIRIAKELVDTSLHRVRDVGGFALDNRQRQAIHETNYVRNDVLVNA